MVRFRALYNYAAQGADELSIFEGQLLEYAGPDSYDAQADWVYCFDGMTYGYVPRNYIEPSSEGVASADSLDDTRNEADVRPSTDGVTDATIAATFGSVSASESVPSAQTAEHRTFAAVVRLQSRVRVWLARRHHPEVKMAQQRGRKIREIVTSETTYVKGLDVLMDVFYKPLLALTKSGLAGIGLDELETVFTPLKPLRELHHEFLGRLREACQRGRPTDIGRLFTDLAPSLQQYTTYVNNYNKTLAILEKSFTNSQFEKTVQTLQATPRCGGLNLYSYLITPVQRIPRYQLLLQDIVKLTPAAHPDRPRMEAALASIVDMATHINDSKRDADNFQRVLVIQMQLTGDLKPKLPSSQARRHVREGVLADSGAPRPERCYWFLFTDYLVYTERLREDQFRIRDLMPVRGLTVSDVPDKDELQNRFTISNAESLYALTAESAELKRAWMEDLRRTAGTDASASIAPSAPPPVTLEGYLMKQGEWNKAFQRRKFVLRDNNLYYYRSETDSSPAGHIPLLSSSLHLDPDRAFRIVTKSGRTFSLIADSLEDKDRWANTIRLCITGQDVEGIARLQSPPPSRPASVQSAGASAAAGADRGRSTSLTPFSSILSKGVLPAPVPKRSGTVVALSPEGSPAAVGSTGATVAVLSSASGATGPGSPLAALATPAPHSGSGSATAAAAAAAAADDTELHDLRRQNDALRTALVREQDAQAALSAALDDTRSRLDALRQERAAAEQENQRRVLQLYAQRALADTQACMLAEDARSQAVERARWQRACAQQHAGRLQLEAALDAERRRVEQLRAERDALESKLLLAQAEAQHLRAVARPPAESAGGEAPPRASVSVNPLFRQSTSAGAGSLGMVQSLLEVMDDLKHKLRAAEAEAHAARTEAASLRAMTGDGRRQQQQQRERDQARLAQADGALQRFDSAQQELSRMWTLIDSERTTRRMLESQLQTLTATQPKTVVPVRRDTVTRRNPLYRASMSPTRQSVDAALGASAGSGAGASAAGAPAAFELDPLAENDALLRAHRTLASLLPQLRMLFENSVRAYGSAVAERDELHRQLDEARAATAATASGTSLLPPPPPPSADGQPPYFALPPPSPPPPALSTHGEDSARLQELEDELAAARTRVRQLEDEVAEAQAARRALEERAAELHRQLVQSENTAERSRVDAEARVQDLTAEVQREHARAAGAVAHLREQRRSGVLAAPMAGSQDIGGGAGSAVPAVSASTSVVVAAAGGGGDADGTVNDPVRDQIVLAAETETAHWQQVVMQHEADAYELRRALARAESDLRAARQQHSLRCAELEAESSALRERLLQTQGLLARATSLGSNLEAQLEATVALLDRERSAGAAAAARAEAAAARAQCEALVAQVSLWQQERDKDSGSDRPVADTEADTEAVTALTTELARWRTYYDEVQAQCATLVAAQNDTVRALVEAAAARDALAQQLDDAHRMMTVLRESATQAAAAAERRICDLEAELQRAQEQLHAWQARAHQQEPSPSWLSSASASPLQLVDDGGSDQQPRQQPVTGARASVLAAPLPHELASGTAAADAPTALPPRVGRVHADASTATDPVQVPVQLDATALPAARDESELVALRDRVAVLTAAHERAQHELETVRESLLAEAAQAQARAAAAEQRLQAVEAELRTSRDRLAHTQHMLAAAEAELRDAERLRGERVAGAASAEPQAGALASEVASDAVDAVPSSTVHVERDALQAQLSEVAARLRDSEAVLAASNTMRAELERRLFVALEAEAAQRAQCADLEQRLRDSTAALLAAEESLQAASGPRARRESVALQTVDIDSVPSAPPRADVGALEAQLAALNASVTALTLALDEAQRERDALRERLQVEVARTQLLVSAAECRDRDEREADGDAGMQQQQQQQEQQLQLLTVDLQTARTEHAQVRLAADRLARELEQAQVDVHELTARERQAKEVAAAERARNAELEAALEAEATARRALEHECAALRAAGDAREAELAHRQQECARLQDECAALVRTANALRAQCVDLQRQVGDAVRPGAEAPQPDGQHTPDDELSPLRTQIVQLVQRNTELEQAMGRAAAEAEELRVLLAAREQLQQDAAADAQRLRDAQQQQRSETEAQLARAQQRCALLAAESELLRDDLRTAVVLARRCALRDAAGGLHASLASSTSASAAMAVLCDRLATLLDEQVRLAAQVEGQREEIAFLHYSLRAASSRALAQQQRADSLAAQCVALGRPVAATPASTQRVC